MLASSLALFRNGQFWLAVFGALLLAVYQFASTHQPAYWPSNWGRFWVIEIGIVGLACLIAALLFWLVGKTHKHLREAPSRVLLRGAMFGMIAGAIVAFAFPPDAHEIVGGDAEWRRTLNWIYSLQRIIAFAGLMGGGMYVMLHLVADATKTSMVSNGEQIMAMALGFSAVFVLGLWGGLNTPMLGRALCHLSFGAIDWIGPGLAKGHGCSEASQLDIAQPRRDIPQIAAAMLGFYFLFVTLWEGEKWRLSFARSIIVIGSMVLAGSLLYQVVIALNPSEANTVLRHSALFQFGPFTIGMIMYAALFSFWITWSRQHSLVEALCNAFGSTDNFRAMVEARIRPNFEVPKRADSLFADVRSVVDRAEANGWIEGLIVNARRSRPEDPKLARLADRYGLGIEPPGIDNVKKAIIHANVPNGAKHESPAEALESVIRQFSKLSPVERREREARLEGRICRIVTPRNEGTGWLVAPDLVLTNFHVVEQMLGEKASVRGQDVVCQFDYKESGSGSVIKGAECALNAEKPVVDYSPYSRFDVSESEELPQADELDFALLRLDKRMGELPIGGVGEPGAPLRGWIPLKRQLDTGDVDPKVVDEKMLLYVLQHPYGGPLKAECGALTAVNANKTRVRHEATTERGSSGSPCFNFADLEPFALHHAGRHSRTLNKPYNQAIPIGRIMRYLRDRGNVEPFWNTAPGGSEKPFVKEGRL